MPTPAYTPQMQAEYQRLFDTCVIKTDKYTEIDAAIAKILLGKSQYETLASSFNLPWYVPGIMHYMECNCNFNQHLHNGDPLTARTVQEPIGRPTIGTPPFSWLASADDALRMKKLQDWKDWNIPGTLYKFETFNGFGYRYLTSPNVPINSPYLWSYSNHYTKGKFVRDHEYSNTAVSKQVGTAVLLRRMFEKQLATQYIDRLTLTKQLAAIVVYAPNRYVAKAEELQKLLNTQGAIIRADGKAGQITSDALKVITGKYLTGDPRL